MILDGEELTIYEIAYNLRMPVYQLLNEMPYDEFLGWLAYFEARPVEWRADDRASKLMQAQGVKEKPWKLFSSLDAIYNKNRAEITHTEDGLAIGGDVKHSLFFQKMMTAVGGDKIA